MIRDIGTGSPHPAGDGPEQRREGRAPAPSGSGASAPPTIEDVIGYEALWDSMEKCRKGVMWKGSVASFCLNAPVEIARLCDELHDGTYMPRRPKRFTVTYPKRREIVGIAFRDRVVQRSYNDVVIYPCMSRSWIYDNYACQKGKGTDFARDRMRAHLERHVRRHGPGFALTVDIRGYYDHLLYEVMGERFYQKCPRWAASFACRTIRDQYGGDGQGVNPGSQLVQIAGVDYLDHVDHMIKERLRVRGYGRYMDGLVLIGDTDVQLGWWLHEIRRELSCVGLETHPTKTRIVPLSKGFRFLGFDYRVDAHCRVVMTLAPENVKAMRRRVSRLWELERSGQRPQDVTEAAFMGWVAHAAKSDSEKVLETNVRWYRNLKGETCRS